jgi:hypothetical protein
MASDLSKQLTLYFRAERLPDKDTFSKSDPYLELYPSLPHPRLGKAPGPLIGRTETRPNDLNPKWEKGFLVTFLFEEKQEFSINIYDDDGGGAREALVFADFLLAQVMSSRGHCLKLTVGTTFIFVSAVEAAANARDVYNFALSGVGLADMDTLSKSDPYFILYREVGLGGNRKVLYKSKVIDDNLDPNWEPCPPFLQSDLSGADPNEKTLYLECFDSDATSDDLIGAVKFSLNELLHADRSRKDQAGVQYAPLPLAPTVVEAEAGIKSNVKNNGYICIRQIRVDHKPTFVELLRTGLQLNLAVSVDFTGSNGDPMNPRSLHYINPLQPNQYSRAIMSVGEILMHYDTDKQVPGFGFGGRMPDERVSHFFNLNLQPNPYCAGVEGLLAAYQQCLRVVRLAGPTNFSPTIRNVMEGAMKAAGVYTILLILTDGEITDMPETIDAIVAAELTPLSIVIVGIGEGSDFAMMNQLDGDDGCLRDGNGRVLRRDLVQFVPFKNFLNAPPGALAGEVLREIPAQVEKWAELTGFKPVI